MIKHSKKRKKTLEDNPEIMINVAKKLSGENNPNYGDKSTTMWNLETGELKRVPKSVYENNPIYAGVTSKKADKFRIK